MFKVRDGVFVIAVLIVSSHARGDEPLSDPEISDTLKRALQQDYRLRDAGIQVSVFQGAVTLKGTVETFLDKHAAEQLTKRLAGVRSVTNAIDVDAAGIYDKRIAEEVRGRIARSSFIRARDLDVRVSSGVVTLDGQVASWEESEQVERVAREVRGVRHLVNQLTPRESSSPMADEVVAAQVETVLSRDAYLAGLAIDVSVDSGLVRLSGEVPNLFHRERAETEARSVGGAPRVQNDLVVVSQLILESAPLRPSDVELQKSVFEELHADPRVPTVAMNVEVSGGEVSLLGLVDSLFAKQVAQRVANRVFGVAEVHNLLEVQPITRDDEEIASDLRANFHGDSMLHDSDIRVVVAGGTATLSGTVASNSVKYHALRVATRVSGVRDINNKLQVEGAESVTDDLIRQNIAERLEANAMTRADARNIEIMVNQRSVVLSGTVERLVIAVEAENVARTTAGVRSVENRIRRR